MRERVKTIIQKTHLNNTLVTPEIRFCYNKNTGYDFMCLRVCHIKGDCEYLQYKEEGEGGVYTCLQ